ncbi:MAG: hypothetical protein MI673_07360 [Thiotrichales bacterium]|nr:hypothetical protein [Thiotrichales bacterium]
MSTATRPARYTRQLSNNTESSMKLTTYFRYYFISDLIIVIAVSALIYLSGVMLDGNAAVTLSQAAGSIRSGTPL